MFLISKQSLLISLICTLVLFIISGCADDLRSRSVFDCGAGDALISFSIDHIVTTKAENSSGIESEIDHAYLLFYSATASLMSEVPVAAVRADVDASNPGLLQFKMPLRLSPNTDYQLLAVANADYYTPSGFESFGNYLESWCGSASESVKSPLKLHTASCITSENMMLLPMSGSPTDSSIFRYSMENGSYKISASLSFRRAVARVDLVNIVKDAFLVERVALCNWRDEVPVTVSLNQIGNRLGSVRGVLAGDGVNSEEVRFVDVEHPDEIGIQKLTEALYCFPSVCYDSSANDKESTALIIQAKYAGDSESTYYRVNIGMKGGLAELKPNTKYVVTIQSVKGRGASTPEEAYAAAESPIVLSVVEDWALEAGNYAMDDDGNFIIVSKGGKLEFDGNAPENLEIKVLTSKGLDWTAEYIADNDESESAFNVARLSDSQIVVGPYGVNNFEKPLSGICRVSATTKEGRILEVNIPLLQNIAEEKPYEPVEPTNLPFSILPLSDERVKIDHDKKTIEIDGFDPNCFNSFIDIPFRVYVNEAMGTPSSLSISSELEWPLEGCVSNSPHADYVYCTNSFLHTSTGKNSGSVYSLTSKKEMTKQEVIGFSDQFSASKDDIVYISVGAMAPDDPAIVRNLSIYANGTEVVYELTIKPRRIIIDDVILTDGSGQAWLIQDRNVQDTGPGASFKDYVGRRKDGSKLQAYNYSQIMFYSLTIPFKYKDANSLSSEDFHSMYMGKTLKNTEWTDASDWLLMYAYGSNINSTEKTSPFYEEDGLSNWRLPDENNISLWQGKLKVSKMRMFFVSDLAAKAGKTNIPICCYLPYDCDSVGDSGLATYGYFLSSDGNNADAIRIFYINNDCISSIRITAVSGRSGMMRLVRPLNPEEFNNYKQNYLGYGSQSLKLSLCHPDTYGSPGWVAY